MKSKDLRSVKCPVCLTGKILIEKNILHNTKLHVYLPENSNKAEFFVKCNKCKNQIGFSFEE